MTEVNNKSQEVTQHLKDKTETECNDAAVDDQQFADMDLSAFDHLKVVYHKGVFHSLMDTSINSLQAMAFDSDHTMVSVKSALNGTETWSSGTKFANVIGSTNDPRPSGTSWINLWETVTGQSRGSCTSLNVAYPVGTTTQQVYGCNTTIIGGHVIKGNTPSTVATGGNVYLIPICSSHNGTNSYYMNCVSSRTAVKLKNFMQ